MSWAFVAVGAGTIIGGAYSANQAKDAAKDAARFQSRSADKGMAEQQRQFDAIQELLKPYADGGEEALEAQRALLGLVGPDQQQQAIQGLEQSPQFQAMIGQGEDALLQNASATGGLRGGNIQGALAQFRPQMLGNLIQQQYQNLGGLTSVGQNAAAMTGNAGMNTGNNITQLLGQQGAAQAGAAIAGGQANAQFANQLASLPGMYVGMRNAAANPNGGKF